MQSALAIHPWRSSAFQGTSAFFGADQGEDVVFTPILADQGGRQPQPPPRLKARRHPEDGRGQQVHLVVDDEPPIALVEQREVQEVRIAPVAPGHDLVGGDRDGANRLGLAGVFADFIFAQGGLVEQLADPLARRGDAGGEDERRALQLVHAGHADDRFSRPARQGDDSRSPARASSRVIRRRGAGLVGPQGERQPSRCDSAQRDGQRFTRGIAGQVLGRIADPDQRLLDFAARGGIDQEPERGQPRAEQGRGLPAVADLFGQSLVAGGQDQSAPVAKQAQAPVAGNEIANTRRDVFGQRVLGVLAQRIDDLRSRGAGGAGVPNRQRRNAAGVNVLGRFHQFGETRQAVANLPVARAGGFHQHGVVALNDERVVRPGTAHCLRCSRVS